MLIVGDSIISDDIKDKKFCCNIGQCRGMCCVDGDFGAPITEEEKLIIKDILPQILPHLSDKAQQVIKEKDFFTFDDEGALVTQIIDGRDCVFSIKEQYLSDLVTTSSAKQYTEVYHCIFQKFYMEQKISFIKPISCHLYPIRISEYDEMTVLNFHEWDVCQCAIEEGKKQNIAVYQNCKHSLIRRFGQCWYNELLREIEKVNKVEQES
ncbi:MAG: DUF3109 family protein [Bacteroidales bacterium]